ncbi:carboxypeptidase-like regulatory domain-containing protein [Phocaeicola sp.]
MRTKNFFKVNLLLLAAGLGLSSCGSDEKKPEIVDDPVEKTIEYYIEGKVTADGGALKDVVVTATDNVATKTDANGQYSLTVSDKGSYNLTFALDGYMPGQENYTATVASDATNRSIVTVNAVMSKKGESVKVEEKLAEVKEEEVLVITEKGSEVADKTVNAETGAAETTAPVEATVAVAVPKGAIVVEEGQAAPEISITPYVAPAAEVIDTPSETPVTTQSSLANLKIESNVPVVVQAPVTVQISIPTATAETPVVEAEVFDEVKVYRKVDESGKSVRAIGDIVNGWKEIGTAIFNAITKSYSFTIAKGERMDGEFSARVEPTITVGKTKTENVTSGEKSNAGNMGAIDYTFEYSAPTGWEATIDASISDATKTQLMATVTSSENGAAGFTHVTKKQTARISGNYNLYYSVKVKYVEKTYSFKLKGSVVDIKVKEYKNTEFEYKNVSASQHSGGGGN